MPCDKENSIFVELLNKQKKDVKNNKLEYNDLKKISNKLDKSIFEKDTCSLWNGSYIEINENIYINFYYNGKKKSIQRLLYENYIGDNLNSQYINYLCLNKGLCCNINHFNIKKKKEQTVKKSNKKKNKDENNNNEKSQKLILNI
jgi:hypothetical protein